MAEERATSRKGDRVRKRVWVQDVAVRADLLDAKLAAIRARPDLTAEMEAVAAHVADLIGNARDAAFRENPIPSRPANWWRGTLIEAAYRNLHAAETLIITLYDDAELAAEIPDAAARVENGLQRDDPRRTRAIDLLMVDIAATGRDVVRERLRKATEVGYAYTDEKHAQLRSFRNLILGAAAAIAGVMVIVIVVIANNPVWLPLCFTPETGMVCPTGGSAPAASDVWVITLLGVLGGTLAGAVSINRLNGTSVPYDVPTALALLKVPFGAMTALGTLIIIQGDFVPGLSELDSQVQILAYALLFGYAQQLLTGIVDKQAKTMLSSLPTKSSSLHRPEVIQLPAASPAT